MLFVWRKEAASFAIIQAAQNSVGFIRIAGSIVNGRNNIPRQNHEGKKDGEKIYYFGNRKNAGRELHHHQQLDQGRQT